MCQEPGCKNKEFRKGYCRRHYDEKKKNGVVFERDKRRNEVIYHDDYIELVLKNKDKEITGFCKVDYDTYEEIKDVVWCSKANGTGNCYVFNGQKGYLHRVIMKPDKDLEVDHINGDTFDNRKKNLRTCTPSENQCNVPVKKHNQAGIKGINIFETKKGTRYRVRVRKDGITYDEYFNTLDEAIKWRDSKMKELHGDFMRI